MQRKDINLYDHNAPFSKCVGDNIKDLLTRIEKNKASLIIIDGLMGEGKTTLAVEIAQFVAREHNKVQGHFYDPFLVELKKQLGMGGIAFQEKLQLTKDSGLKVVIYDEAGDFSRRGAITSFNQKLNRIFQTFRTFKVLIILCLPSFDILDNNLFQQGVPRLLLNCHGRNQRQGNIRGYGYEEMLWLKHYMNKEVVPLKAYKKVNPNFRGHFINLPPKLSAELDIISTEFKSDILSDSINKNEGLVTVKEIMAKLNKSASWVKLRLNEHGFKAIKKHKLSNYYDKSIIEKLEELEIQGMRRK